MKKIEEIQQLLKERKNDRAPIIRRMQEVKDAYNGDLVVPLPELDRDERSAVANLVQLGVEQTAMRIVSTMPGMEFPTLRVGVQKEMKAAQLRKNVVEGWWNTNHMTLKLKQRARWFIGYGVAPVEVNAGMDGQPRWTERDPLGAYPATGLDPNDLVPPDCIFEYKRGREWLERTYPEQMARLNKSAARLFSVVEYIDDVQKTMYVCGTAGSSAYGTSGSEYETLHTYPNAAERPLVVFPGRITLDRLVGQFDGMIGMYQMESKIMSLFTHALQRGIFPETWIVDTGQGTAEIITAADAKSGVVGHINGGDIKQVSVNPGVFTSQAMDRLHGAQREEGGIPAEMSGLSSSNIRTGRRGEQVMSAAVDFRIQEAQQMFELSLTEENKIGIAVVKAYGGRRSYSMYTPMAGQFDYTPSDTFPTDVHEVRYAYAGADANAITVSVGQKIGMGVISHKTAMKLDPLIPDAETEMDQIRAEMLEQAFMQSLVAMAQDPASPIGPSDWARINELVTTNRMELFEAFQTVHDEAQKRQAAQQQAPPGMPPGPGGQPGLNEAPPSVAAPPQGMQNLNYLLGDLHRSSRVAAS